MGGLGASRCARCLRPAASQPKGASRLRRSVAASRQRSGRRHVLGSSRCTTPSSRSLRCPSYALSASPTPSRLACRVASRIHRLAYAPTSSSVSPDVLHSHDLLATDLWPTASTATQNRWLSLDRPPLQVSTHLSAHLPTLLAPPFLILVLMHSDIPCVSVFTNPRLLATLRAPFHHPQILFTTLSYQLLHPSSPSFFTSCPIRPFHQRWNKIKLAALTHIKQLLISSPLVSVSAVRFCSLLFASPLGLAAGKTGGGPPSGVRAFCCIP